MRWLDVLHVLDSGFPTGAYAHSAGLETLAPENLQSALELRLEESLSRLELVFVRHAYTESLTELDALMHACLLIREPREASRAVGKSLLRSVCKFVSDPRLLDFLATGKYHHHAVVFGAIARVLEMEPEDAAEAYAFNSLRAQVSAAQRLGWIGQNEAQRVLHALKPGCRAAATQAGRLHLDEAGAFAPLWDIAAMRHERAAARMFAS